jgi:ribosomal protein S18 acetylase RimI-like enzyme
VTATDDVRIVPTTEAFIPGLQAVVDAVARERKYIGFIAGPPMAQATAFVRSLLAGGGVQLLAINAAEQVVGWCDIVGSPLPGFRHVGRLGMGLLSDYRGQGLGGRLATQAIAAAREAGMERIELEVFASNTRAIALYQGLGFVTEGVKVRSRKLDGVYDDNVFMALLPG